SNKAAWFLELLSEAIRQGIVIISVTQCKGGGAVNEGKYESSFLLGKLGIISGYDIITESAVTKLMYLLGREKNTEDVKTLLNKSLRGEMSVEYF
ncbi:MAG: L-asparaginase 1, partial [Bacteroidales bacterium]|nr:L-asparaginase 1 [Bacteroidales bacterium]